MRYERIKRGLKLRLLVLVLVVALLWYSINPAPAPLSRAKGKRDEPPAKRGELEPEITPAPVPLQFYRLQGPQSSDTLTSPPYEPDDFDWPEFIDG
jgi:hypothetical protein